MSLNWSLVLDVLLDCFPSGHDYLTNVTAHFFFHHVLSDCFAFCQDSSGDPSISMIHKVIHQNLPNIFYFY